MPMEVFDAPPPDVKPAAPKGEAKAEAREHPWVQANRMAREGKTPEGKSIGTELAKPLVNPETLGEYATGAALTAPLIAAGGAGAGALAARAAAPRLIQAAAPAVGRIATSGGIGAARGHGTTDTAFSALAESIPIAGRVASKIPIPKVGKLAGPTDAIAEIKRMLGAGPEGTVNLRGFDQLMAWWRGAPNPMAREVAGEHVAKALAAPAEKLGFESPDAARLFRKYLLRSKVSPEVSAKVVGATHPSNVTQATVDAAFGNTPLGAVAGSMLADEIGAGRMVPHRVRQVAEGDWQ